MSAVNKPANTWKLLRSRFRILILFYAQICALTLTASAFTCLLYLYRQAPLFLVSLFWAKVASTILALLFFQLFQQPRLYFFYNLGFERHYLYLFSFVMDMSVWIILITIVSLL